MTLKHRLPLLLWPPNLIGYVRVATLAAAMLTADPASPYAVWMVAASLALDYFDGPCARRLDMCSQFGDLLDHYTDHANMLWLVWVTTRGSDSPWATMNLAISTLHNGVAFVYAARLCHGSQLCCRTLSGSYDTHSQVHGATRALFQAL